MYSYIKHRLQIAGCHDSSLFTKRACEAIYKYSNGIPRLINILCHKSLISAYGEGKQQVTHKHVKLVAQDIAQTQNNGESWLSNLLPLVSRWLPGH
jgi:MSHA biogenesis protein MshM